METQRFITLAIHTYHRAEALKSILQREGIEATLQNVNLETPHSFAGVRVRIKESDLPYALRIVENPEVFADSSASFSDSRILVPIDFTQLSKRAVGVAFLLAARRRAKIHLIHSYSDPAASTGLQLSDMLTYDSDSSYERSALKLRAEESMEQFSAQIKTAIKAGELPPVTFSTQVSEGLPEDVVLQWSKANTPLLIVMGTRGAETKERELIGSVTAEVLDTVRYPIFTVPPCVGENDWPKLSSADVSFAHVMLFVNFDQQDCLALDALHRFMPKRDNLKITFVKIEKNIPAYNAHAYHNLLDYAEKHYPECHFSVTSQTVGDLMESLEHDCNQACRSGLPDLIVVPNKKKNAFARLFNPGIAHRLLFHVDIPMMVVPV